MHVYPNADKQSIFRMIRAGAVASVLAISDPSFANDCKRLGGDSLTVVSRQVFTGSDGLPNITGDEQHDREVARGWYDKFRVYVLRCDQNVYVQLVNEQNVPFDGFFYDELMACIEKDGHKLAMPADGGGCPGDYDGMRALWFDNQNLPQSDFFVHSRGMAIRRAAQNGHLYLWHSYGDIRDGNQHPNNDIGRWPWFSGRGFELLSLIPEAQRPHQIIGEYGTAATQFTQSEGFDQFCTYYDQFEAMAKALHPAQMSKLLGVCCWTFGEQGFPGQDLQQWDDQFIKWQAL